MGDNCNHTTKHTERTAWHPEIVVSNIGKTTFGIPAVDPVIKTWCADCGVLLKQVTLISN